MFTYFTLRASANSEFFSPKCAAHHSSKTASRVPTLVIINPSSPTRSLSYFTILSRVTLEPRLLNFTRGQHTRTRLKHVYISVFPDQHEDIILYYYNIVFYFRFYNIIILYTHYDSTFSMWHTHTNVIYLPPKCTLAYYYSMSSRSRMERDNKLFVSNIK